MDAPRRSSAPERPDGLRSDQALRPNSCKLGAAICRIFGLRRPRILAQACGEMRRTRERCTCQTAAGRSHFRKLAISITTARSNHNERRIRAGQRWCSSSAHQVFGETGENHMTQFAAVNLQALNYIRASDGTGNSKPYIWPVLVWIDNAGIGVTSPPVDFAEVVIVNGMHAGETASIPASIAELNAQIGDGFLGLILVVALWDQRATLPTTSCRVGFRHSPASFTPRFRIISLLCPIPVNETRPSRRSRIASMGKSARRLRTP